MMTDAEQQERPDAQKAKRSKGRSPSYPGIDLETAIQRADLIYRQEGRHPAHFDTILKHWGYKPTTGPGLVTYAALKKFDLLIDEGSGLNRRGRLSQLALDIIEDERPDSSDKLQAIQEAALKPGIHRELWEEYKGLLPSDDNLRFTLLRHTPPFTPTGATEFVQEFQATIAFAKLAESARMSPKDTEEQPINKGGGPKRDGASGRVTPFVPPSDSAMQTMPVPVAPGKWASLNAPFPLTEAEWQQMLTALGALKPGLVVAPSEDTCASGAENDEESDQE